MEERRDGGGDGRIVSFDRAFGWGFAAWGGKLFFSQYDWQDYIDPSTLPRLWATDGTPGGTLRLSDTPVWASFR